MANFIEELWTSIFTPGPTPTLLIATNASFASLQILLFILLIATNSIHFIILSFLCGGLWYSINWFAKEVQQTQKEAEQNKIRNDNKKRNPTESIGIGGGNGGSDTETEDISSDSKLHDQSIDIGNTTSSSSTFLKPEEHLDSTSHRRKSNQQGGGDNNSGYVSTDSEWEKISTGDGKG